MRVIVLLFLMPICVMAQRNNAEVSGAGPSADYYLRLYAGTTSDAFLSDKQFQALVNKLESKRSGFKTEAEFLQYVFNKTHQKFLKNYEEYTSFPETLIKGKYNCLTGTALYAVLLHHFRIPFKVIETNYHIFLEANTVDGKVLFEATDPVNGFVVGDENIGKRILQYKEQVLQQNEKKKVYYRYNCEIFNEVTLEQLAGLLHYNEAIVAYNAGNLSLAVAQLDKTMSCYTSSRIDEFSKILLLTLSESKMEPSSKAAYVRKLKALATKMPGVSISVMESN